MLNSRLLVYNKKPLSSKFHLDMYPVVKRTLRLRSRRLVSVGELFGIGQLKTRLSPKDWVAAAMEGDKKALANIVTHNKNDVILLEEIYKKLFVFVKQVRRM